jgi:hypothetical protein
MSKENKTKPKEKVSLTRSFTSDLKSRQSVRASFRLTQGCIEAISIVANQMGIKQKSLFDHMAEDMESLKSIAQRIKQVKIDKKDRIQKTFVISRKSLASLDKISNMFDTSRDGLVEHSIQRLLPIISREQTKHKIRKEFLTKIKKHFQQGEKLLYDVRRQLGDDDPIINQIAIVISSYETVKENMESFIERSKDIETFDTDNMNP